MDKKKRGLLIVFEGVDRVGKSTQVEMLKNYFIDKKAENCEKACFPGKLKLFYIRPLFSKRAPNKRHFEKSQGNGC